MVAAAAGQVVLDTPKKIADASGLLDSFHGKTVRCDVLPITPRLSFSLRLQSGYFWHLHLSQSQVAGQKWLVLARVTPNAGNRSPVYFSDVVQFPADGDIGWEAELGHFWVGEGRYAMKILIFDDRGRACRQELRIDARLSSGERKIDPLLPPNTVAGVSWSVATSPAGTKPASMNRLTIMLDVADQIRTPDQIMLMDALTALIGELPARSVRLVLFDLTQQREIFRRDSFTSQSLPEVAQAMSAVQFEPVNAGVLQTPGGGVNLIENLANLEVLSPEPSDAVVFLGVPSIYNSKPSASFGRPAGAKPQFFYLQCPASRAPRYYGSGGMVGPAWDVGNNFPEPLDGLAGPSGRFPGRGATPASKSPARGPDSIEYAVDQLGGKTLKVDSPDSFAKAVLEITRLVRTNK